MAERAGSTSIVIAVAEPLLALGLRAALQSDATFTVAAVADRAEEVPAVIARLRPDVLLLDTRFRAAGDRDLLAWLPEHHPDCRVLVLVDHNDDQCTVRALLESPRAFRLTEAAVERLQECCLVALRSQARGCIPKSAAPEVLLDAVRTVAAGGTWAGPGLTAGALAAVRRGLSPEAGANVPLSPREVEIVALVVEGLANKEIGFRLHLSEQTIKNQLTRILDKLGLASRVELALFAVRQRLA